MPSLTMVGDQSPTCLGEQLRASMMVLLNSDNSWKNGLLFTSPRAASEASSTESQPERVSNGNMQHRGKEDRQRETEHNFGTNPCSEIVLRDCEFCNLTEMVVRADDTRESFMRKARLRLGTWQSTLTDFRYLSSSWKKIVKMKDGCVSMTGIMDCELTNGKEAGLETLLYDLRQEVVEVNRKFGKNIGVEQSVATTRRYPYSFTTG